MLKQMLEDHMSSGQVRAVEGSYMGHRTVPHIHVLTHTLKSSVVKDMSSREVYNVG